MPLLPRTTARALLVAALLAPTLARAAAPAPLTFDGGAAKLITWQFQLGDNPAWSAPSFDDSAWQPLTADKPWGQQGHKDSDGIGWYRFHVALGPGHSPDQLAILLPRVEDAYELYWNGQLVGSYGRLPPHPIWYFELLPRTFGLGPAQSGVLAVRVWKAPLASFDTGMQGGFYAPPVLGSPSAIAAAMSQLDYRWLRSRQYSFAITSLYALIALFGFGIWIRDRSQWLAFWMGCFSAARPLSLVLLGLQIPLSVTIAQGLNQPVYVLGDISLWFVLVYLLDLHSDERIVRLTRIFAWVEFAEALVDGSLTFGFALPHPLPYQFADLALMPVVIALELFPFYLIGVAVLRRSRLDPVRWLVAVLAFLTQTVLVAGIALSQGTRFTHITLGNTILAPMFVVAGNPITARTFLEALLLVAIVYGVYRYSAETRRAQIRLEEEIRNARAVQQVLIPDALPAIPGFNVDSVYKPAEEVGGDFFQIIPLRAGGVLTVIGDVSGKGIPAAMTVSLLVGTVRTLAHFTESPAEILAAMNQRMLSRSHGGFTTCLVLRADPDGQVTVANAGHLAPYLRGRELAIDNGLPLGVSASAAYSESELQLAPGEQLTLLTDGVVEARNKTGELFGFERTSAIALDSAESIAQAAQRFGQHDDITVLTLSRQPLPAEAAAPVATPIFSPSPA